MSKGKIISPNQIGGKGIPPSMPSGKAKRSGIISPNQLGKKGMPVKGGVKSRPAPLD